MTDTASVWVESPIVTPFVDSEPRVDRWVVTLSAPTFDVAIEGPDQ